MRSTSFSITSIWTSTMLLLVIDRVLARVQLPAPKNSRYHCDYLCNATVIAMQQQHQQPYHNIDCRYERCYHNTTQHNTTQHNNRKSIEKEWKKPATCFCYYRDDLLKM